MCVVCGEYTVATAFLLFRRTAFRESGTDERRRGGPRDGNETRIRRVSDGATRRGEKNISPRKNTRLGHVGKTRERKERGNEKLVLEKHETNDFKKSAHTIHGLKLESISTVGKLDLTLTHTDIAFDWINIRQDRTYASARLE